MNQDLFYATNPATGEQMEPAFREASDADVNDAVAAATRAFELGLDLPPGWPADLLDAIADRIMALGDALLARGEAETALPRARLVGERARTVGQLKMFADIVREGSWVEAVIDTADPDRKPQPKPDLRRMLRPRGPVAVFGASNFPFAFGTAGGDTASALVAGCPVIVKGHPSHPGTSDMFADAIRDAIGSMKLPRGFFALLQGRRHGLSAALVKHADITAVGFTGSLKAGRALFDVAAARPSPIPVFAEMGSLNPLVVMPEAMIERGADIARGLAASLLLGGGQFCTKPGVVLLVRNDVDIVDLLAREVAATKAVTMLNASLCGHFSSRVGEIASVPGVKTLIRGEPSAHAGATPTLLETTAQTFIGEPRLREEMFGPAGLLVRCRDVDEAIACLDAVGGSLTGTVHHGALDATGDVRRIIRKLQQIAGRVIVNGYPTGVEVCNAIVHGGPYPATTDPSSTSVGSAAIRRWVRMAAYQDVPDALLPPALQNANPLSIERIVNGTRTREPVSKSS